MHGNRKEPVTLNSAPEVSCGNSFCSPPSAFAVVPDHPQKRIGIQGTAIRWMPQPEDDYAWHQRINCVVSVFAIRLM